jgi:hypothetical protein
MCRAKDLSSHRLRVDSAYGRLGVDLEPSPRIVYECHLRKYKAQSGEAKISFSVRYSHLKGKLVIIRKANKLNCHLKVSVKYMKLSGRSQTATMRGFSELTWHISYSAEKLHFSHAQLDLGANSVITLQR